jgi:hypothetical protein
VDDGATLVDAAPPYTLPGDGVSPGLWLYLTSDRTAASGDAAMFCGFKATVTAALNTGTAGGAVAVQFWGGSSWEDVAHMSTAATAPYTSHGRVLFAEPGVFQVRLDGDIVNRWVGTQLAASGLVGPRFWLRIGTVGAGSLVSAPVLSSVDLHTSSVLVNGDGFSEFFGTARPVVPMTFGAEQFEAANNIAPDADIFLSQRLAVGRTSNRFNKNPVDRVGLAVYLPPDIDTSSGVLLNITWATATNAIPTATFVRHVSHGFSRNGDAIATNSADVDDTVVPSEDIQSILVPVPTVALQETLRVRLDVSAAVAVRDSTSNGDVLWISVERDGPNPQDDLDTNMRFVQMTPLYTRWSNGAHASFFSRTPLFDALASGWLRGGLSVVTNRVMSMPPAILNTPAIEDGVVSVAFVMNIDQITSSTLYKALKSGSSQRILQTHAPWSDSNFYFDAGSGNFSGDFDRTNGSVSSSLYVGTDVHVVEVKDRLAGRMTIYVNGTVLSVTRAQYRTLAPIATFEMFDSTNQWKGVMKDFRVYQRALGVNGVHALHAVSGVPAVDVTADFSVPPTGIPGQDNGPASVLEVLDGGAGIRLVGDTWKSFAIPGGPVTVVPGMVLEFDFEAAVEGEVHGVALTSNATGFVSSQIIQVFGTQNGSENHLWDSQYAAGDPLRHYEIPIGSISPGTRSHFMVVMDDDSGAVDSETIIRNLRLRAGAFATLQPDLLVDFSVTPSSISGQNGTHTISTSTTSVDITGNTWRAFPIPQRFFISESTRLALDFSSTVGGEFLGVYVANSLSLSSTDARVAFVASEVGGTEGIFAYNDYVVGVDGIKAYDIPFGRLTTAGAYRYFVVMCDDDAASAANITVSNVRMYDTPHVAPDAFDPDLRVWYKFDETAGAPVAASSVNGFNATIIGTA